MFWKWLENRRKVLNASGFVAPAVFSGIITSVAPVVYGIITSVKTCIAKLKKLKKLVKGAKSEVIIKGVKSKSQAGKMHSNRSPYIDHTDTSLLLTELHVLGGVARCMPAAVFADGYCFFNSLSIAIAGNFSQAEEVNVHTCNEMVANWDVYIKMYKNSGVYSPDYLVAMRECAEDGSFSSAWTINAASTVLNRTIVSVYPPVNGLLDNTIPILNKVFITANKDLKSKRRPIFVMWRSCQAPVPSKTWHPNHFVPLLLVKESSMIALSDDGIHFNLEEDTTNRNHQLQLQTFHANMGKNCHLQFSFNFILLICSLFSQEICWKM